MKALFSIFLAPLVAVASLRAAPPPPESPDIVLILADDLGYGDPACFNPASKIATPHIDSLARDGVRFTDAHAPGPLCHMSRYGLMTGRFPFRIDVTRWPTEPLIRDGETTLPSVLAGAGYRTAMVGKWHVGFRERGYDQPLTGGPADRGFQSYFGIRASTDIPPYFFIRGDRAVAPPTGSIGANDSTAHGWSPIQGKFWRAGGIAPELDLDEVLPRFTDEAVAVIRESPHDQPLFLYLAYPAPHTPWLPSDEFAGKSQVPLYGDFVEMVDAEVGRVLGAVEERGRARDTIVVFTSDNGPVWYDGDVERFGHDSSGGLRGMKGDAWEGGHRMPFVARWPARAAAGATSDRLVCFTDVVATFAELVGAELEPGAAPDSVSFLGDLTGAPAVPRPPIVMQSARGHRCIRSGPWKLIDALGSGGFTRPSEVEPEPGGPRGQLYHLGDDPDESDNLCAHRPEIVAELESALRRIALAEEANSDPQ